jgi:membrane protein implicated in regulation of membrane protease activity
MVSYIKTQWWRLVMAAMCLVPCIVIVCTSTTTSDSIEGLTELVGELFSFYSWFFASCSWLVMSIVDHNADCIRELNKRIEELEARAITDIDKISENNYMVRRRLGPDEDIPFPEED